MKFLQLLTVLIFFPSSSVISQLSITAYTSYAIGIETKLYKNLSGEFRIYTNDVLDETNMEVQFYYGFLPRKYHQFRIGAGINANLFDGNLYALQLPVQLYISISGHKKSCFCNRVCAPVVYI
jgi:hypothetical protein